MFFSLGKTKTCSYADALLFGRERKRSRVFSTLLSVSFVCVLLFVVFFVVFFVNFFATKEGVFER